MSEVNVTDATFEAEVLQSDVPVLVDFWAPWCGPCKMMGPIVEELAKEYDAAKVKIAKINIDENGETPQKYGVMSIPTFVLFKNGEVVETVVGGVGKEKLQKFIEKHIS